MAATTASETREVEDMGMPRQRKGHSERHGEGYGEGDLNSLKRIPPAWAGAVVPFLVQLHRLGFGSPTTAAFLAAGVLLGVLAARRSALLGLVAVAAAIGVDALSTISEPWMIAYLAYATAVAGCAVGVIRFHRDADAVRRRIARPTAVLAVPLLVSDLALVLIEGIVPAATALGVGVLLTAWGVVAPRSWARLDHAAMSLTRWMARIVGSAQRLLERGFRRLGSILAVPLIAVVFLVVVALPWLVARVTRANPTWSPLRGASRWVERRSRPDLRTGALWFADPGPRAVVAKHRWLRVLPNLALVGLLILSAPTLVHGARYGRSWFEARVVNPLTGGSGQVADEPGPGTPAVVSAGDALLKEPWFRDWDNAYNRIREQSEFTQYAGVEFGNFTSKYLNEKDSVRRSWTPPADPCKPRLRVWMFGGSTLFGLGQRDEHTASSELARLAWDNGVALEISNYGIPGDVSWIEQHRLERAMALTKAPPDLVVFYDGYNDMRAPEWSYMAGRNVTDQFMSLNDRDILQMVSHLTEEKVNGKTRFTADEININKRVTDEKVVQDAAVFQLTNSLATSRTYLAARKIPMVSFYQPILATREPVRAGDFPRSDAARARALAVGKRLPVGTIDISDAMNESTEPFFADDSHTNERANLPLSARMWKELTATIAGLVKRPVGVAGCS